MNWVDLGVEGRAILDYGCGAGQNAIACARAGARRVLALDPSLPQLDQGRALAERLRAHVDFRRLEPDGIDELPGGFDIVLSVYALHFVADIRRVLATLSRRLRAGGQLVVSVDHPIRVAGEWRGDDFVLPDYFVTGWQRWDYDFPEHDVRAQMRRYRRPVADWVDAVVAADLRITRLLEPIPASADDSFGLRSKYGEDDPRNVFSRARLKRVPGSLILVAERGPG